MKKILSWLLVLCMLCSLLPAAVFSASAATDSGDCGIYGDNLVWTYESSRGHLQIRGSGAMEDFSTAPWAKYKESITTIDIGSGVTSIGKCAFAECSAVSWVDIPETVTSIGYCAFGLCTALTRVDIRGALKELDEGAFAFCYNLEYVFIAEGLKTLRGDCFIDCENLTLILIPKSVTTIEKNAFNNCNTPAVVYGGTEADWNKISLNNNGEFFEGASFFYEGRNYSDCYYDICGVNGNNLIYELDYDTFVMTIAGNGDMGDSPDISTDWKPYVTSLVVRDGVTSIGFNTFSECPNLESISLPNTLTHIGEAAFGMCPKLKSVTIPGSVTKIEYTAFALCDALQTVIFEEGFTSADYCSFAYAEQLNTVYIPTSMTVIGRGVFDGCDSITTVHYAGSKAQWDNVEIESTNGSLANATVYYYAKPGDICGICGDDGANLTWSYDPDAYSLYIGGEGYMSDFDEGEAPWSVYGDGISNVYLESTVASIGDYAFAGCSSFQYIDLPQGLDAVGAGAFKNCTSLKEITVPGDAVIGNNAFSNCSRLRTVTLEEGITSVPDDAFKGCSGLRTIYFPKSVKSVYSDAFYGCNDLSEVFYTGSRSEWKSISIHSGNDPLLKATIHYNCNCDHDYNAVVTAPTCTASGYTTYTCIYCGDYYTDNYVSALGHLYSAAVTEPTCETSGYTTYTCSRCKHSYTGDTVPALNHNYESVVTPPTCVDAGYTTYTCANCGDSYISDHVDPLGHDYKSVVTPPTCKEEGYTTYTCCRCGDSYVDNNVSTLDHNYTKEVTTAPTCVETGVETYTCTGCGQIFTVVLPALGHTYESEVTAPTCETSGYTTYTCTVCGDSYADDEVPATGHLHTETSTVAPTCTANGSITTTCKDCGEVVSVETISAPGHSYELEVTAPTCEKDGYTTYTCTVCGDTYVSDAVPATGHVDTKTDVVEATCVEDGIITVVCNTCGEVVSEKSIPAFGHSYTAEVTAPTCEEDGYTTYTCATCGDTYADNAVPALGHTNTRTIIIDPTCTDTGTELILCACGEVVSTKVIPATGHSYSYTNNGEDHTVGCEKCDYSAVEAHTYENGLCVCGAEEVTGSIPASELVYMSKALSLQSYIAFDCYVTYAALEGYDSWYVVFERYDYAKGTTVTETVSGEDFVGFAVRFEYKVNSYQMADTITATIYAEKDGKTYVGESYVNSVAGYVNENIVNASSDAHATVYANLLNYGAKAQIYMKYNVENLADAGLGEYASYVTTTVPTAESVFSQTNNGLNGATLVAMSLGINAAVEIQTTIMLSGIYTIDSVYGEMTFVNAQGKTVTQRIQGTQFDNFGIMFTGRFNAMTAMDGRVPVEITIYDQNGNAISETWTYSVASYLDGNTLTGDAQNALYALVNYYDSAAAFF